MTCSASGLSIGGGTPVRCFLLTRSPYDDGWLLRTPPIRAVYDSYGSIEEVHEEDKPIADLWMRGLREDLVELGQGDNSCHDVPTSRSMTFEALLEAIRGGRVLVRQDIKTFWTGNCYRDEGKTFVERVRETLDVVMPGNVSSVSEPGKYVVDEPVPNLARVRFGKYLHGEELVQALVRARAAVEKSSFVGAIVAGSGRYADEADLLVFLPPKAGVGSIGPQWDEMAGRAAGGDKHLAVSMAMIREDVWQAIIAYPHHDIVTLACVNCGQESWYHEKDRVCPTNKKHQNPYKEHAPGATYAHGPVFATGIPHVVTKRDYGETVWYGLAAIRHGVWSAWARIVKHFKGERDEPLTHTGRLRVQEDQKLDPIKDAIAKERARIAALPDAERTEVESKNKADAAAIEAEHLRKRLNPRFGDFPIRHHVFDMRDPAEPEDRSGASSILWASTPGVIGISEHLSMLLADKTDPAPVVLDSVAELVAVRKVLAMVGVSLRPATSSGPQYAEWPEFARFHRTLLSISETEVSLMHENATVAPSTLDEVLKADAKDSVST